MYIYMQPSKNHQLPVVKPAYGVSVNLHTTDPYIHVMEDTYHSN